MRHTALKTVKRPEELAFSDYAIKATIHLGLWTSEELNQDERISKMEGEFLVICLQFIAVCLWSSAVCLQSSAVCLNFTSLLHVSAVYLYGQLFV